MIQDNWLQFNVIKTLTNKHSYAEYAEKCIAEGITPKNILEYAQKVGLLAVAEQQYPDLSAKEAYIKIFEDFSEPYGGISISQTEPAASAPVGQVQSYTTGCNTCGGGKAR